MKTTLTTFLLFLCLISLSQTTPQINVWLIHPDTVCPGDSISVDYKYNPVVPANNSTVSFVLQPGNITLWAGPYQTLPLTKHHHSQWGPGDSAYTIKLQVPLGLTTGTYSVKTNGTYHPSTNDIFVKMCSCTVTAAFSYTANYLAYTFSSTPSGYIDPGAVYKWNFFFNYQAGSPVTSYTFPAAGTYTVGHRIENPLCSDQIVYTITVTAKPDPVDTTNNNPNPVGILELSKPNTTPVYFDIYGNKTEFKPDVILIEQVGLRRRKVFRMSPH